MQSGIIAWAPSWGHAAGAPARSAAVAGASAVSHKAAWNRMLVTPSDAGEASQTTGGAILSGAIR